MELTIPISDIFTNDPRDMELWNRFSRSTVDATDAIFMWAGSGNVVAHDNYNVPASAGVKVASSSAADTGTLSFSGLDANLAVVSGTITLTGVTPVTNGGLESIVYMNRMSYDTDETLQTNTGDIYCYTGAETAGVPDDLDKILIGIPAGLCTTQGSCTTVRADADWAVVHNVYVNGDTRDVSVYLNVKSESTTNATIKRIGPFTSDSGEYMTIPFMYRLKPGDRVWLSGSSSDAVSKTFTTGYDLVIKLKRS